MTLPASTATATPASADPMAARGPTALADLLVSAGRGAPSGEVEATLTSIARLTRLDRIARRMPTAQSAATPAPRSPPSPIPLAPWPLAGRLRRLSGAVEQIYGDAAADRLRRAVDRICATRHVRLGPIETGRAAADPEGDRAAMSDVVPAELLAAFDWEVQTIPIPRRRLAIRALAGSAARRAADILAHSHPEGLVDALGASLPEVVAAAERADETRRGPGWLSPLRRALAKATGPGAATIAAFKAGRGPAARAIDLRAAAGSVARPARIRLAHAVLPEFDDASLWEVVRRDAVYGHLPDEIARRVWRGAEAATPSDVWSLAIAASPALARSGLETSSLPPLVKEALSLLADADALLAEPGA